MTPLVAAGVFAATAAGLWWYAESQERRDWYNRRTMGGLWRWFDRDAWRVRGIRLTSGVLAVAAVVTLGSWSPVAAVAAPAAVVAWRVRRGRSTRAPVARDRLDDDTECREYAAGGFDPHTGELRAVKIGVTRRPVHVRIAEIDAREQTLDVRLLASTAGDEQDEAAHHAQLDEFRYPRSEWFHPAPGVLDAVASFARPTREGRRVLRRNEAS